MPLDKNNGTLLTLGATTVLAAIGLAVKLKRGGSLFVIVDTSKPGGEWIGRKVYNSSREADAQAAKLRRRVSAAVKRRHPYDAGIQVIDALWYGPAAEVLERQGVIANPCGSTKKGNPRGKTDAEVDKALADYFDVLDAADDEYDDIDTQSGHYLWERYVGVDSPSDYTAEEIRDYVSSGTPFGVPSSKRAVLYRKLDDYRKLND